MKLTRGDDRCECDEPSIRCDQRGCYCTRCLRSERRVYPGLQKAIDETKRAIDEAAKSGRRALQENEHGR